MLIVACRDAEVKEVGVDMSAVEVEAQAVPEAIEGEGHMDATSLPQLGGQKKTKLSMDSSPLSPREVQHA